MGFEEGLAPFLDGTSGWAGDILRRLIAFRSTPGAEAGIQDFLFDLLSRSGLPGPLRSPSTRP